MAKKQLGAHIDYSRGDSIELANQCLRLLRRYPKLAQERYEGRVNWTIPGGLNPLTFVLRMGATLDIVKEVHDLYPNAVSEVAYTKPALPSHFRLGIGRKPDFPLHKACQWGGNPPEVIQFLARAAPKVVAKKDSLDHLPLHSILRNSSRSATVTEVETLLDIYPAAIEEDCGRGTPAIVAHKCSRTTNDVLELLMQRSSIGGGEFHLPSRDNVVKTEDGFRYILSYDRFHTITLPDAQALATLLQHDSIRTISCLPKWWHRDAFLYLMKRFKESQFLLDLSLHVPPSKDLFCVDGKSGEEVCHSLQSLLEENTTLQCLHIDFGTLHREQEVPKATHQKCIRALVPGLCANRSLRECYLSGSILTQPSDTHAALKKQEDLRKELWAPLADNLRQDNLSLEWISLAMVHGDKQELSKEALQVQYWTALNRCGRAKARNPNLSNRGLVQLITKANQLKPEIDFITGITYGLLQECPGLWSSSAA